LGSDATDGTADARAIAAFERAAILVPVTR
jgi:hypothetical protein